MDNVGDCGIDHILCTFQVSWWNICYHNWLTSHHIQISFDQGGENKCCDNGETCCEPDCCPLENVSAEQWMSMSLIYKYVQRTRVQICANTNMCKYKYLQKRVCAARIGCAAWRATYAFHPLLVAVDWQEGTTQIIRWGAQFPCLWFIVFPPSGSRMAAKNPSRQSLPCSNFALAKFQISNSRFCV